MLNSNIYISTTGVLEMHLQTWHTAPV